jgi:hypothetical protein
MANTYQFIASNTVGSGGVASVTFSSIPSTYTDLCLKISARSETTTFALNLTVNGSSSDYSERLLYASSTSVASADASGSLINWLDLQNSSASTANTFSNCDVYIPNYAGSNFKSFSGDTVTENNSTSGNNLYLNAALWSNTAAITSITLTPSSGDVAEYSTFYLYGIKKN